jgi:hypothetical protein
MTDQLIKELRGLKEGRRRGAFRYHRHASSGVWPYGVYGSKFGESARLLGAGSMRGMGSPRMEMQRFGMHGPVIGDRVGMLAGVDAVAGPVHAPLSELGSLAHGTRIKVIDPHRRWMTPSPASATPESAPSSPRRMTIGPEQDAILFEAAESLRGAALREPDAALIGHAASLLHRAAQREADRRPRHAAIALAAWDAIECTEQPFITQGRRQVFFDVARTLLAQFISTDDEIDLLDRMDAVGLERIPPFEETFAGSVFERNDGDALR